VVSVDVIARGVGVDFGDRHECAGFEGNLCLAFISSVAFGAPAHVIVLLINTCAPVQARTSLAIIALWDLILAIDTIETSCTFTCVLSDTVCAHATILAWLPGTIINVGIAILSCESFGTLAIIRVETIMTNAIVLARVSLTIIGVDFAIATLPTEVTDTFITVHTVNASSTILARFARAIINVDLAIDSFESFGALARVFTNTINALASILTWIVSALVHIGLTILPGVSFWAHTGVIIDAINTLRTVLARGRIADLALVDVDFAVGSGEAGSAIAGVFVVAILAPSTILTWLRSALIDIDLASVSFESRGTLASIRRDTVHTRTSVLARRDSAIVDVVLTILAVEAFGALARISVVSVDAFGTILARLIRTIIHRSGQSRTGTSTTAMVVVLVAFIRIILPTTCRMLQVPWCEAIRFTPRIREFLQGPFRNAAFSCGLGGRLRGGNLIDAIVVVTDNFGSSATIAFIRVVCFAVLVVGITAPALLLILEASICISLLFALFETGFPLADLKLPHCSFESTRHSSHPITLGFRTLMPSAVISSGG
jgi:hypothetical protein